MKFITNLKEMFFTTWNIIREKFSFLKKKFLDFYKNNKKIAVLVIFLVIFIVILLIILIANSGKKETVQKPQLIVTETPEIPDGPEMPEDYAVSRTSEKKWSEEDADEWFTVPSSREVDSLSASNKKIINEIIKAAP